MQEEEQNSCTTKFEGQMEVSPEALLLPALCTNQTSVLLMVGKPEHPEEAYTHTERTGEWNTERPVAGETRDLALVEGFHASICDVVGWWQDARANSDYSKLGVL